MSREPKINMLQEVLRGLGRMAWAPFRAFLSVIHWCTDNYRALAPRAKNDTWIVVGVLIAAAAVGAVFTFDVFTYSYWKARGSDNAGEIVRNLGLLAAAIVGLGFGIWRAWTAYLQTVALQKQVATTEQGHITDRFSTAVEHMGSEQLPIRLGGIYALWRLTEDSSARYVATVADILCAFVRNPPHDAETLTALPDGGEPASESKPSVRPDVQAILTLIGNASATYISRLPENYVHKFEGANLRELELYHARLTGVEMYNVDLSGALLFDADLTGAKLYGANLTGAYLTDADLTDARLGGAYLTDVIRLTQEQIDRARPTEPPASLPDGIVWPFEQRNGEWVWR